MNILVVGGAGYIGSHMVRLLQQSAHEAWVYDNLSTGHRQAVPASRLIEGDLGDRAHVENVLRENRIDAVMHFAACALVSESVRVPAKYYQNNIAATLSLMEAMRAAGVRRLVFSSTAATYGEPLTMPISETIEQRPINPYGFTKLVVERALQDYARAYDWGYAALRYFNAAGASPAGDLGEYREHETRLIPLTLHVALSQRDHVTICGDDYETPDGTCIRDYVHVDDLAAAHLAAVERLELGAGLELNLGTGRGHSVREVIDACRRVTGHEIPAKVEPRRPGDPAILIADASMASKILGWQPQYTDIDSIVRTAWRWHKSHPRGFADSQRPEETN